MLVIGSLPGEGDGGCGKLFGSKIFVATPWERIVFLYLMLDLAIADKLVNISVHG